MSWWQIYLSAWVAALGCSIVSTILFCRLGSRLGFLDHPRTEEHKQHCRALPKLGGPAMFTAWVLVLLAGLLGGWGLRQTGLDWAVLEYIPGVWRKIGQLLVVAAGAGGMLLLGLMDDWRALRPSWKMAVQLLICGLVAAFGLRITLFIPLPLVNWGVSVLWLLLIVNAVNIFDNMDGMAGGCGVAAAFLFFLIAALQEQYFVALLSGVTGGAVLGFLFFNWPPARIFMGDSGSHFIGYLLAVLGILTTYYSPLTEGTPAALLIPLLILALPIFDFFAVIFLRLRQGTPIYQADNQHLSHRLIMTGLSQRGAAWAVNLLGLAIGAGAVPLLWLPGRLAAVVFIQAGAMLALVTILHTAKYGNC